MRGLSRETENTITPAQEKLCHTSGRRAEKPDGRKSLQMRNWKKIYGWQGKQQLGKGLGTPAGGSVGDLCALYLSHGGGLKTVSEDNTLLQEEKTPTSSPFIMCRYPMKVFHCLLEGKTVNVICWEKKLEAVWGLRTLEKELVLIFSTWVQYQHHLILDHCTSVLNCPSASPTTPFIDTNQSKKKHSYRNHTEF